MTQKNNQIELLRQVRMALKNNQYESAIGYLKQMVSLTHDSGDFGAEGRHLGNLALVYYRLKQYDVALDYFNKALQLAVNDNDKLTQSGLLGNIGNVLREVKRCDEAVEHLNRALSIAKEVGDVRGRGIWLSNLGLVYDDMKKPAKAIEFHNQAVAIARELHDQRGLASRLGNLGNSYMVVEDRVAALTCFVETVEILPNLGDRRELLLRLRTMGKLHDELGQSATDIDMKTKHFDISFDLCSQSLKYARQANDSSAEAEVLRKMGDVLVNKGQHDRAVEYYNSACRVFKELGFVAEVEKTMASIKLAVASRDSVAK